MKSESSKAIIQRLKKAGYELHSVRGSHHYYKHPVTRIKIPVPHPRKDLGVGLTQAILKQAGLK
ncbi:addiction module toxin, HicA family [Bacillus cereus]|uniref:type II toxin-antitoxin system HicA family toxin n=1 Tax=Bacillus cereus TaxID=1396 RepID=UPI000BF8AF33|nr:type II toxin-antitoxin system HicA family toxin [Bacillus cereus]PEW58199.1 addiction module toxin, HicA family [Bacillus cereus]